MSEADVHFEFYRHLQNAIDEEPRHGNITYGDAKPKYEAEIKKWMSEREEGGDLHNRKYKITAYEYLKRYFGEDDSSEEKIIDCAGVPESIFAELFTNMTLQTTETTRASGVRLGAVII